MQIGILGIDLGKNSCSVVGLDVAGRVVLRRRLRRDGVIKLAAGMSGCVMAMEACCGAHHLGRLLRDHGHQVRLMSPEYVRPYVKAQKNDDRDAEAIAEAATRPTMRFVELKSEAQLEKRSGSVCGPGCCLRTCVPSGANWTGVSWPSMTNLQLRPARTRPPVY
jgi:transposase